MQRNNQSLKGAVVVTHCQNEAELKFSMEIDHHTSSTEKSVGYVLISPACSVDEILRKFPLEIIPLPQSGRGSRQMLLSIPETSVFDNNHL